MRERFGARSVMMDTLRAASVLGAPGGLGGGGVAAGASLAIKQPARVATTGNITLSGLQTIDGVTVAAGDRVLVKDQTAGAENGIYVAASGAWARDTDFDEDADARGGVLVAVSLGTTYGDTIWQLATNDPITIGATSLSFLLYARLGNLTPASVDAGIPNPGSVLLSARSDHKHTVSVSAPTAGIDIGDISDGGIAATLASSDHQHAFPAPGAGYPLDVASAEADGAATTPARSDHVHAHGSGYLPNAHHAQSHVLATTGGLGADHTVSGLTAGQYLRATGAATAAFQAIPDGDLPATIVRTSRQVIAGSGLTGGGALSADVTLNVGAGNGITVNADNVALTIPGTLSVSSVNSPVGSHTHAITASADPGVGVSALLKSDTDGGLTLRSATAGAVIVGINTAITGVPGGLAGYADVANGTGVYGSGNAANGVGVYGFVGASGDATSAAGYFLNQASAGWAGWFGGRPVRIDSGGLFIGDTANAFAALGLTINQGANDNEIIALKSSDVAHGMTSRTETDTFGTAHKEGATTGGLVVEGYSSSSTGLGLYAKYTTGDTTKTTAGTAGVRMDVQKKSGTSSGMPGADENLVVISAFGTTRFIFDNEGSAHADVEWITFDEHDDVAVLSSLEQSMLTWQRNLVKSEFNKFLREHAGGLERLGIIHFDREAPGHAMVNFTRLSMLLVGAVRQLAGRVALIESRLLPSGA